MKNAEFDRNTIILSSKDKRIKFRASGSVLKFVWFFETTMKRKIIIMKQTKYYLK